MNARKEFERFIDIMDKGKSDVLCAMIQILIAGYMEEYSLKVDHTPEEYEAFLKAIDYNYDDGHGSQELEGAIWFKDGTWASRWEYDGSEGWQYNVVPIIPDELK